MEEMGNVGYEWLKVVSYTCRKRRVGRRLTGLFLMLPLRAKKASAQGHVLSGCSDWLACSNEVIVMAPHDVHFSLIQFCFIKQTMVPEDVIVQPVE